MKATLVRLFQPRGAGRAAAAAFLLCVAGAAAGARTDIAAQKESARDKGIARQQQSIALQQGIARQQGIAQQQGIAREKDIVVFAAASLKNALDDADASYERDTHRKVRVALAATSALARQIEAGAPADVFISADLEWMDYLAARKLIRPETRSNLVGNRLVLIAPSNSTARVDIGPEFALAAALGGGRLAMADPASVPAGKYGKAALEKLGVWSTVANKVAPAENVRAALILVARGEAPLGIVYQTDAAAENGVRIAGVFPASSHPPIVYPVAVTAASGNPAAAPYVDYLKSQAAAPAFQKQGFTVLD